MGSGLDDYPRREDEFSVAKQHVDLLSWLYLFSNSLSKISKYMGANHIGEINSKRGSRILENRVKFYDREVEKYLKQLFS